MWGAELERTRMLDNTNHKYTQAEFQRRPGGRNGCGCCGLYLAGFLSLSAAAIALFLTVV